MALLFESKEAFIHRLVKTLSEQMGTAFPELKREEQLAFNVIREEENSFLKTLDQGLVLLESIMSNSKTKSIEGTKVFELYDTFGFPFDLTALIASEKGFSVDEVGFQKAMEVQKHDQELLLLLKLVIGLCFKKIKLRSL